MKIEALESFLIDHITTKETLMFRVNNVGGSSFTTTDAVADFLESTAKHFHKLSDKAKLSYLSIYLSSPDTRCLNNKIISKVPELKDYLTEWKIKDNKSVFFSNNIRKRYEIRLDKYLDMLKMAFDEETQNFIINKNIKELSPNIIVLFSEKPELMDAIKRKKVNKGNFIKLAEMSKYKKIFLHALIKNPTAKSIEETIAFFEKNKLLLKEKNASVYFSFLSLLSIGLPLKYKPEDVLKEYVDYACKLKPSELSDSFLTEWRNIGLAYFSLKYFEDHWCNLKIESTISNKRYLFKDTYDSPHIDDIQTFLGIDDEILNEKMFKISSYKMHVYFKKLGIYPFRENHFSHIEINQQLLNEIAEFGETKRSFLLDVLGFEKNEIPDANQIHDKLERFSKSYLFANLETFFKLIPFEELIDLKHGYSRLFQKTHRHSSEGKNEFTEFKAKMECISVIATYIELADEDLYLSDEGKELLSLNHKI